MKTRSRCLLVTAALLLNATGMAFAQGTAFMYHGRLTDNGIPASGNYDLTAAVFDADIVGNQVGVTLTNSVVTVNNGLFTVTLDFGTGVFDGRDRWLEIGVRPGGVGDFTLLNPRQLLTPTPYAITASNITGTLEANQLTGTLPESVLGGGRFTRAYFFDNPTNSFTGNGAGLNEVNAASLGGLGAGSFWQLGGNAGTTPGVNFLGTTDNQPLELKVNGQRAFRLEGTTTNSPNVIGGFQGNYTGSNVIGATIGGGGDTNQLNLIEAYIYSDPPSSPPINVVPNFGTVGGGVGNQIISGSNSTISGGFNNSIYGGRSYSFAGFDNNSIGGGANNRITGLASTIAGGDANSIIAGSGYSARYSTIGGGESNSIRGEVDPHSFSTISGGAGNTIRGGGAYDTIGGGSGNAIGGYHSKYSTISGGATNRVLDGTEYGTIGGGLGNAVGMKAVIGGGEGNYARLVYATIGGGQSNRVDSHRGTIPGGVQARTKNYGQFAYASGQFDAAGDAQTSVYVCRGTTINASLNELFLDGASQRMLVPENSTWGFDILVSGRAANGDSAAFQIRGSIKNNSGATTIIGSPVFLQLGTDNATWNASVDADDENDALIVRVNGAVGTRIRWVASVRTVEVTY